MSNVIKRIIALFVEHDERDDNHAQTRHRESDGGSVRDRALGVFGLITPGVFHRLGCRQNVHDGVERRGKRHGTVRQAERPGARKV